MQKIIVRSCLNAGLVGLALVLFFGEPASCQLAIWTPPKVTMERLSGTEHPRLPPDEVEAGDFLVFSTRLNELQSGGSVQRQDIGTMRVETRGQWFLSVEAVAKEEAAKLGANFLILESSVGREEFPGSTRIYRAVRLQTYGGLAVYTRSQEAVEGQKRGGTVAVNSPAQALKKPVIPKPVRRQDDFAWLWSNERFILSHRFGVNLRLLAPPAWKNLEHTIITRFPKSEHEKLRPCFHRGATISIDLKQEKLWPSC